MSFNPIVANLLATENLTVIQGKVKTAGFDVEKRVLILPTLLPEFDEAYGMLIGHEVGHARYTTQEFNKVFLAASNIMKQYYNVCEDVRVEKLIKRQYPGLRKVMVEGYEIFNRNNFFLPKNIDPNTLSFIDRINVYAKVGLLGINFNDEERTLVSEVEHAESVEDVIIVAKKIYALAKSQLKNEPKKTPELESNKDKEYKSDEDDGIYAGNPEDSPEYNEPEEEDSSSDNAGEGESKEDDADKNDSTDSTESDGEDGEGGKNDVSESSEEVLSGNEDIGKSDNETVISGGKNSDEKTDAEIEDMMQSLTERALSAGMEHAANSSITVNTFSIETKFATDPIHSYKHILKNLSDDQPIYYSTVATQLKKTEVEFNKFEASTKRVVAHMFKEFEMRKCAHRQRYAQISKTGQLNSNKLFAYKIRDELFKTIKIEADDKNHGMLFLLDWSGSMSKDIHATICQLMSLAMFCRKVKIPFKVFAFTNGIYNEKRKYSSGYDAIGFHEQSLKDYTLMSDVGSGLSLLELFSDSMNEREFTRMSKILFAGIVQSMYGLGSTPLNQALIYMHSYVAKYKQANNIEKLTFVVLTDGEGDKLCYRKANYNHAFDCVYGVKKIIDPITRDVYDIDPYVTPTLLKMIKKSANCSVIGFYVCSPKDVDSVVAMNYYKTLDKSPDVVTVKNEFKKEGYVVLEGSSYDKLYLVGAGNLKERIYNPEIKGDMSAASIAREMVKQNNTIMTNKLMMGKIIGEFAVGA